MKTFKKIFCLLLAVTLITCAVPFSASASDYYERTECCDVGETLSFYSDFSAPTLTHSSGEVIYKTGDAENNGSGHYTMPLTITKAGVCKFVVKCEKYAKGNYEIHTITVISRYKESSYLDGSYNVKVDQDKTFSSLLLDLYDSEHLGKIYGGSVYFGKDVANITGTNKVTFKKTGFAWISIAHEYRAGISGSYDSRTTYIAFNVGNAVSTACFMAESDGSSGGVTNMPSPNNIASSSSGVITIPSTVPKRAGYAFVGWTDSGPHRATKYVQYEPGKSYIFADYSGEAASTILYPVWRTCEVTFDANGGTGAPEKISATTTGKVTIPEKTPTKSGYVFYRWVDSLNGKSRTITAKPGDVVTVTKDTTLYALYEEIPSSIYVGSMPTKTVYNVGESLDLAGLSVVGNYSSGKIAIDTKELTVTGFSSATAGTKTITVTYLGKTTTFDVTVTSSSAPTLSSISVKKLPDKTIYKVGESFNSSGLVVTANYSNGTKSDVTSGFTFTGFNSSTTGTKTVTVTYMGKTATFNVTVNNNSGSTPVYDIKPLGTKGGVKFNQIVTVNIALENLPEGCTVMIDDKETDVVNGIATANFGRLTLDKTFTVKVLYNEEVLDSEQGTITVPRGFFDKFAAFFAKLFQGEKYAVTINF